MGNCLPTKRKESALKVLPWEKVDSTQTQRTDCEAREHRHRSSTPKAISNRSKLDQRPSEIKNTRNNGLEASHPLPRLIILRSKQKPCSCPSTPSSGTQQQIKRKMTKRISNNSNNSRFLDSEQPGKVYPVFQVQTKQPALNQNPLKQEVGRPCDSNRHKLQSAILPQDGVSQIRRNAKQIGSSFSQKPIERKETGHTATTAVPHSKQYTTHDKFCESLMLGLEQSESSERGFTSQYIDTSRLISLLEKGNGNQISLGFSLLDEKTLSHF